MKALRNYLDKIKPNFEEGGKFHCSKNKNIRQNEKHCNRCLFQFFQVLPLFCFFISKTMYHY